MFVYILPTHLCLVPTEARRQHWVFWNWNYRWLWCWKPNLGPLEEKPVLFACLLIYLFVSYLFWSQCSWAISPASSLFWSRVSLCNSPSCPRTCSVEQAVLELSEILLPLPPKCWDWRCAPPSPSSKKFYRTFSILLCVFGWAYTKACVWQSEDSLQESVLPFYHRVPRSSGQSQWQVPLPAEPFHQPRICLFYTGSADWI